MHSNVVFEENFVAASLDLQGVAEELALDSARISRS
jgi:hypothetical protein